MNKLNKKEIELIKTQAAAINILNTGKPLKIIAWWSGDVTSAVACWFIIKLYGLENIRFVFIDTKNESEDTYRFKRDRAVAPEPNCKIIPDIAECTLVFDTNYREDRDNFIF